MRAIYDIPSKPYLEQRVNWDIKTATVHSPTPQRQTKNKEQKTKQKQMQKQNNPPQEKPQDHLQTFAVRHCTHWSLILLLQ